MLYIDSSALVKTVIDEAESAALRTVAAGASLVSSALVRVEVGRALRRASAGAVVPDALLTRALSGVALALVSRRVLDAAVRLGRPELRSLDAIHLATALTLEIEGFVAYDHRLLDAAASYGLPVLSPGA